MVVRSPCPENDRAHTGEHKSVESANTPWTRSVHLDAPGQRHGPGVVKRDKSSRGSVDTWGALSAVHAQCNYLGFWPYQRPIV